VVVDLIREWAAQAAAVVAAILVQQKTQAILAAKGLALPMEKSPTQRAPLTSEHLSSLATELLVEPQAAAQEARA
jgi:hypothetical protein